MAHVVDAADELCTVMFGYARCSHVAVPIRVVPLTWMGGDRSQRTEFPGCLWMCCAIKRLNCVCLIVLTTIMLVLYIHHPKREVL